MDNNDIYSNQSDSNQQTYGGQPNPNQQPYNGQQMNPQYGGQPNPNQQMYGGQPNPNQQMYGGQPYQNQQMYGGQPYPNQQMYGMQPQNQQFYGDGRFARVQERNIGLAIVLTIVTCGIYGLYWLVCLVNDLNEASDNPTDTSGGLVLLLIIVTCGIYGWYWYYKAGEKVDYIHSKSGRPSSSNTGILYLILGIFGLGIVNYCLIQNELNQVAAR